MSKSFGLPGNNFGALSFGLPGQIPDSGLNENTVLYLPLDADFEDYSSYSHPVTEIGNPTLGTFKNRNCAFLDGNDALNVDDSDLFTMGAGEFTIDTWVKMDAIAGTQQIVYQCNNAASVATTSFGMSVIASGKVQSGIGVGGSYGNFDSNTILNTNGWYHLAYIREKDVLKLYVNGNFDNSVPLAPGTAANDSAFKVGVGRPGEFNGNYLSGKLMNVRITRGEVLWKNNFQPPG